MNKPLPPPPPNSWSHRIRQIALNPISCLLFYIWTSAHGGHETDASTLFSSHAQHARARVVTLGTLATVQCTSLYNVSDQANPTYLGSCTPHDKPRTITRTSAYALENPTMKHWRRVLIPIGQMLVPRTRSCHVSSRFTYIVPEPLVIAWGSTVQRAVVDDAVGPTLEALR